LWGGWCGESQKEDERSEPPDVGCYGGDEMIAENVFTVLRYPMKGGVSVMGRVPFCMSQEEALNLAAWLAAIAVPARAERERLMGELWGAMESGISRRVNSGEIEKVNAHEMDRTK